MGAWLRTNAREVVDRDSDVLAAQLSQKALASGLAHGKTHLSAWKQTIEFLMWSFDGLEPEVDLEGIGILFEYEIPRRPRRVDVVVMLGSTALVVEFKIGSNHFDRSSRFQVLEYSRDLRDFHVESRGVDLVPVLVATNVEVGGDGLECRTVGGVRTISTPLQFRSLLGQFLPTPPTAEEALARWDESEYRPTPGIIEAARELYAGHNVRAISHAWADNLESTVDTVRSIIARAKAQSERWAVFITGVPGSGKTLAGLSAIHPDSVGGLSTQPLGAYLSGNGPLVDVLRYALGKDLSEREGVSSIEGETLASALIQPVHLFVREYASSNHVPPENVIVFDEAQRAWGASQMLRKEGVETAEADLLFDAMDRVPEWAVVVGLVGEGQEINSGEAGISAWADALRNRPTWKVAVADDVKDKFSGVDVDSFSCLHLSVNVRAPRAAAIAAWADALLVGRLRDAASIAAGFPEFPIIATRDLGDMRAYLRDCAGPDRRTGLLASSQARRLRPFGIEMDGAFQGGVNWPRWFVDPGTDIRSSYALEVAASEFKCQGLEIDYAGLCWGDDLLWEGDTPQWVARRLRGSKWITDSDPTQALNRYRVLLTRARYGLLIWVPKPNGHELLVDGAKLDRTFDMIVESGATIME